MVFPSVPVYLDPPNWHQQLNHHQQQGTGSSENPQLQVPPPLPTPTDHHHHQHVGGAGLIRPGSTADQARLANKVPQPVQKCPRCDSTNTKFCYFNNYSLTQPRHFCKTCRRYWTKGGALRNVPVGGGCRRNKKKKNSSSKSTAAAERQSGSNSNSANNAVIPSELTAHLPHQTPHLPNFMASLQSFSQYGGIGNMGLNFGGGASGLGTDMGFQIGTNSDILSVRSRTHQPFPFFEPNNGLYNPLQSEYMEGSASMVGETQFLRSTSPSTRVPQRAGPVKMDHNNQGLNLTRSLLGVSDHNQNNQYWGGNNWTDLSGLK